MENLRIFTAKYCKVCELFDEITEANEIDELDIEDELNIIEAKMDKADKENDDDAINECYHHLNQLAIDTGVDIY